MSGRICFVSRYHTRDRAARRSKVRIYTLAACRRIWRSRIWRTSSVLTAELSRREYCATTSPVSPMQMFRLSIFLRELSTVDFRYESIDLLSIFPTTRNVNYIQTKIRQIVARNYHLKYFYDLSNWFSYTGFFHRVNLNSTPLICFYSGGNFPTRVKSMYLYLRQRQNWKKTHTSMILNKTMMRPDQVRRPWG